MILVVSCNSKANKIFETSASNEISESRIQEKGSYDISSLSVDEIFDECKYYFINANRLTEPDFFKNEAEFVDDYSDFSDDGSSNYVYHYNRKALNGFDCITEIGFSGFSIKQEMDGSKKVVINDERFNVQIKMNVFDYSRAQSLYERIIVDYPDSLVDERKDTTWTAYNTIDEFDGYGTLKTHVKDFKLEMRLNDLGDIKYYSLDLCIYHVVK